MKLRHLNGLDRVVRLAVAFDTAEAETETVTFDMPEDVAGLSDTELLTLHEQAVALFSEVYGDGNRAFTPEDLEVLRGLRSARDVLTTEESRRAQVAAETAAAAHELAAGMAAPTEEVAEEAVEAEPVPVAAAAATEPLAAQTTGATATTELVAAAPRQLTIRPGSRRPARQAPVAVAGDNPLRANTAMNGLTPGQPMTMTDLATAYASAERGVNRSSIDAAIRGGRSYTSRTPIGQIHVPYAEQAIIRSEDPGVVQEAIRWATDESRLSGGSLVAAGGWCAPSERVYDLCQLESTAGIISLPQLNPTRGGIENTLGPDWRDIFADIGFCFTEAEDITGVYSTSSEVQTLTEGGAGLTSYTITWSGQTTASIDDDATAAQVQAALELLSNIAPGDVVVTGGPLATGPFTLTWGGAQAGVDVPAPTTTPTGGSGTVVVATSSAGGVAGGKPCSTIDCPPFIDHRLDVCGVCINAGILMNRAYPELVRRYTSGSVTAHMHRVAAQVVADLIAGSTAITVTDGDVSPGAAAPLLSAIELRVQVIRESFRMSPTASLEAVFPFWVRGLIRADLSRRLGVDMLAVSDAMINGWFGMRGINPQFIYNFDGLASTATEWPLTVRFLLYPAGTWVRLGGDVITLEALHDSTLNANNNYTALFTEESIATMKTCHVSEIVTVPVCASGATQGGVDLVCDSTP